MKPGQLGGRSIVTGDAEHCIEVLKACEEGGIAEVILYFNFGELSHTATLEAMGRFATEVMPHFAERKAPVAASPGSTVTRVPRTGGEKRRLG